MSRTDYVDILFGALAPDLGGRSNPEMPGYLVDARGVLPSRVGYRPIAALQDLSGTVAVTGTLIGRIFALNASTTTNVFSCTASTGPTNTRIHQTADGGQTWSDIEGASGAPGLWADFCVFDNLLICGSRARAPQQKSIVAATGTALADLAGTPPTGATISRVRDHVVIGNLTTDSLTAYAVQWGAIGDPEDWPTPGTADARSKQAGIQYFPAEYGQITKVVGGEKFGLVFQQRAVTRMTYIGGSNVFEFDLISQGIGTGAISLDFAESAVIPHAVVTAGNRFYWANGQAASGFFVSDGYYIRRLSAGRTDSQFLGLDVITSGAFDPITETVFFARQSAAVSYAYNIQEDKFSYLTDGSNIESICANPSSSAAAELEKPALLSISQSRKLQSPSSSTKQTIAMQTGYVEIDPGHNVQVHGAHLLGTGTSSLTLSAKAVSSASACDISTSGFTEMTAATLGQKKTARLNGQYVAFQVSGAGGSSQNIHGIRVYFSRSQPAT